MKMKVSISVAGALLLVGLIVLAAVFEETADPTASITHDAEARSPDSRPGPGPERRPVPGRYEGAESHRAGFTTRRSFGRAVEFDVGYRCNDSDACAHRPVARHEYARYTDAELETLAGYDGPAAIVLANRLGVTDQPAARQWALRGFLLTGDPYAYHMTLVLSGVQPGALLDADGRLDIGAAEEAYIWLKLGHRLGVTDDRQVSEQERILAEHEVFDAARLDREVEARFRGLVRDRLQLTGRTF